jgi:murein endopeptidase
LFTVTTFMSVSFLTMSSLCWGSTANGGVAAKSPTSRPSQAHHEKEGNRIIASSVMPEFVPDEPESDYTHDRARMVSSFPSPDDPGLERLPTIDFCSEWNPEFPYNGHRCCRPIAATHKRKLRVSCYSKRPRANYCGEMTDEQKQYISEVSDPTHPIDPLQDIDHDLGRVDQAYCTPNNGFLAYGRPLVPTATNRIQLRSPERCTEFGSDNMVGMLEWLGRQVAAKYKDPEYTGVHLLIGDVSAPRGGCLAGPSGRHGHLSHTNGSDADVGLLTPLKNRRSPASFTTTFDAKANWWMIKKILKNPYACVKVMFLDRRWIHKLARVAAHDEDWHLYAKFIRHQKGHRNHVHVRVGNHPGEPGCYPGADPSLEEEADIQDFDEINAQMAHPTLASGSAQEASAKPVVASSSDDDSED